jgi:hypothetical protein
MVSVFVEACPLGRRQNKMRKKNVTVFRKSQGDSS